MAPAGPPRHQSPDSQITPSILQFPINPESVARRPPSFCRSREITVECKSKPPVHLFFSDLAVDNTDTIGYLHQTETL